MRALLRLLVEQHDYRRVLSAGLLSLTGDWILRTGLTYQVFVITGSTMASGAMLLASFLPQIVLGSLAGSLVDRWDRRRTMVVANLLLAAGLMPLLLADRPDRMWIVYVVMLWEGSVQVFFEPAEKALIPSLVQRRQLITANALSAQSADVARLAGGAIGGLAAAWGGIGALALLDLMTFVLSALLLARVGKKAGAPDDVTPATAAPDLALNTPPRKRTSAVRGLYGDWVSGLHLTWRHQPMRVILGFVAVTSVGQGIMSTLLAPFVIDVLHGSSSAYGTMVSAQAVGGIAGGLVTAVIGSRFGAIRLWGIGALMFAAIDLVVFCYPLVFPDAGVWPAVVGMALVGLPAAFTFAGLMTAVQQATTEGTRGRAFGVLGAAEAAFMLIGIGVAATLGDTVNVVWLLSVQAAGLALGGWLVLGFRNTLRTSVPETERVTATGKALRTAPDPLAEPVLQADNAPSATLDHPCPTVREGRSAVS